MGLNTKPGVLQKKKCARQYYGMYNIITLFVSSDLGSIFYSVFKINKLYPGLSSKLSILSWNNQPISLKNLFLFYSLIFANVFSNLYEMEPLNATPIRVQNF